MDPVSECERAMISELFLPILERRSEIFLLLLEKMLHQHERILQDASIMTQVQWLATLRAPSMRKHTA